jgi:hypothetical protein
MFQNVVVRRKRDSEKEGEREMQNMVALFLFLTGMTAFSYLVFIIQATVVDSKAHKNRVEMVGTNKCASLQYYSTNRLCKKFYGIDPFLV